MKKIRIIICMVVFLYIVLGVKLATSKRLNHIEYQSDGETIRCNTSDDLQIKFLGNDNYLYEITLLSPDADFLADAQFLWGVPAYDTSITYTEIAKEAVVVREDRVEISLSPTKLIFNRDYYLRINMSTCGSENLVRFTTSDEQLSTFVNGERAEHGIALKASFEDRYRTLGFIWKIIFLILPVLTCISYFGLTSSRLEAMAIYVMSISFLLYLFSLLGILPIAIKVLYIMALLAMVFLIYTVFRSNETQMKDLFFDSFLPNFCVLGIIGGAVFVLDYPSAVWVWDDYKQWAFSPKLMYMFEQLPLHSKSTLLNYRYYPVYSLFQYGFLSVNGRYSETILYIAKHFLEMGLFFGCMPDLKKKQRFIPFLSLPLFLLAEELFCTEVLIGSLQVDLLLGIALGYVLVKLYLYLDKSSPQNGFLLFLATAYLSTLKDTGWMAIVILCGIILLRVLVLCDNRKVLLKAIMLMGAACFLMLVSWNMYVNAGTSAEVIGNYGKTSIAQTANINSNTLMDFLTGKAASYKYQSIPRHIVKMLIGKDYPNTLFSFSFLMWCFILLLCVYIIMKKNADSSQMTFADKNYLLILPGIIFLEILFMQIAYIFTFSEKETLIFESENRYLGSVLLAIFLFGVFYSTKRQVLCKPAVFLSTLIIVLLLTGGGQKTRARIASRSTWSRTHVVAQKIREVVPEEQRVIFYSAGDDGYHHYSFWYEMAPNYVNYYLKILDEDFLKSDYLYLGDTDNEFINQYGKTLSLREESDDISPNTLYRLHHEADRIVKLENVWTYN